MLQSLLQSSWLPVQLAPLYGGGFWVAYAQLCAFYYCCGILLHNILPALINFKSVQPLPRKPWSVQRDAFFSLGAYTCSDEATYATEATPALCVYLCHIERVILLAQTPCANVHRHLRTENAVS
jgi:hypothetical protein